MTRYLRLLALSALLAVAATPQVEALRGLDGGPEGHSQKIEQVLARTVTGATTSSELERRSGGDALRRIEFLSLAGVLLLGALALYSSRITGPGPIPGLVSLRTPRGSRAPPALI